MNQRLAPEGGPKRLNKSQISRAAAVLEMIQHSAADLYEHPAP
jgi:hypothetical protein